MEIVDELDPTRRGVYAGAVMYLDYSGNLDSCIAIRTIVTKKGRAYFQAGAGIVADSVAESEYVETVNKASRDAASDRDGGKLLNVLPCKGPPITCACSRHLFCTLDNCRLNASAASLHPLR